MNLNVNISKLPADVRRTFKQLQVLHAEKQIQNKAKSDFLSFVKCMWPDFIEGSHHRLVAEKFNKLATGELKRLIINMPPRHTKSEFASFLLPAWMVGRNPKLKIIQATHTGELALDLFKAPAIADLNLVAITKLESLGCLFCHAITHTICLRLSSGDMFFLYFKIFPL